ncbi:MAG: hypothetical protein E7272_08855 [Pseudobutyrivibrio ruminis]|uniref:Uncharacterized protein n=1 Tax=Pseudobutyrivibrio ruminis TaxID=46206 RepID=A0A927UA72_9FIRM|nr:hypothetical protein [Pseudobutyrivibrio ruminis]
MDFRTNDEMAERMMQVVKKFDETAYSKPWNGKRNRLIAKMHYGHETDPGMKYRAELTVASDKIYWWIGKHCPFYMKYESKIDEIDDEEWKANHDETRIIFYSEKDFFEFVNACLDSTADINTPMAPKGESADGFVVICPRCDTKFRRAERCPDCGQLIKY